MIGLLASIKSGITTLTGRLTSGRATALDNLDAAVTTRLGSIKSIQRNTIVIAVTAGTGSNTASISSVTTSKSIITNLGATQDGVFASPCTVRLALTNGTTVTASAAGANGSSVNVTVGYQVVEFN